MKFEKGQLVVMKYLTSDKFKHRDDTESTLTSIPKLLEINKAGFITVNSQEGIIKEGFDEKDDMFYELKERAYVEGFMKRKHGIEFIDKMNMNTNKVAYELRKTGDGKSWEFDSRIVVTIYREGPQLPLSAPFEYETCLHPSSAFLAFSFGDDYYKTYEEEGEEENPGGIDNENDDVIKVVCFDPQYGRQAGGLNGLYQSILDHL